MTDNAEAMGKRRFLVELSRRHVWRAAVLYAGAAWALSQGIAQLGPLFNAPNWAMRGFVVACVIGFPFWLAFAWFYAWTPQGFKREQDIERTPALTHATGRKLDFAIIGVMAVVIVLLASGYLVHRNVPAAASPGGAVADFFDPPADTLVVLPFANESGDPKQQYFSDGITEELTNALGRDTALSVIAWDTASHYRDHTQSATVVGRALDVANVLTGKILRDGNEVRVIVELVNARNGYQVWADHYDDTLANVFAVQDQITAAIAGALKVKLASLGTAETVDPEAHDLVLQARALMDKAKTAAPLAQARKLLQRAIALDPRYADAHAGLAGAWFELTQFSMLPLKDVLPRMRAEANRALELDPRNVAALLALGNAEAAAGRSGAAKGYFERALAIDPSNAAAHVGYGNVLPLQPGLAQYRQAVRLDPDSATAENNLSVNELDLGDYPQALAPDLTLLRLDPHSADNAVGLAETYELLHRDADAVKVFDRAQPDTELAKALVTAGRLTYQSLLDPKSRTQAVAAVTALRTRADLDPFSLGDVLQLELALGENAIALNQLPEYCAATPVGCSDLSVNPTYLPLRSDPRFKQLVRQYDTVSKPPASPAAATSESSS